MKKVSKTLAIVLCLALILSLTAVAAWTMYQGDIAHTGQITDAAPHITSNPTVSYFQLPTNGGGWSGVDNEPVMRKEGNTTYAYVLHNGHSGYGGTITKVNCVTGAIEWYETQVTPTAANQLSTPFLDGDNLYYVYNIENTQAHQNFTGTYTANKTVSITTTLSDGGSYRLYVPSRMTVAGTTTLSVTVTKPDNTVVSLNLDNDDPEEVGNSTSRTLTTSSTTSPLNKNYADVFAAEGTYTITFTYSYTSGTYSIGHIYLYRNNITLNKLTGLTSTTRTISPVATDLPGSGQMNTPITTDGTYLYFGTWMSGTAHGTYYQVDPSTGDVNSYHQTDGSGFYWAGAVPVDTNGDNAYDYVVFGGDGGYLYYRPINNFDESNPNGATGGVYNLSTIGNVTAGNVRSTVSSDGTYIYFTSQGSTGTNAESYIWRAPIASLTNLTAQNLLHAKLGGATSTSTPAISESGLVYVGYYNGFSTGGIDLVVSNSNTFEVKNIISGLPPVQSSVDVYYDLENGYDYIFFTTNATAGGGYCYRVSTTSPYTATQIWNTASVGNNTCLQGMAACSGYLTFGNDSNRFFIVNP